MKESIGAEQLVRGKVCCNCCGRVINAEGMQREEYLQVAKVWGYFSSKDLTKQAFNLCESCYDKLIASFKVPVEEFPVDDFSLYTEEEMQVLSESYAKEFSK